MSLYSAALGCCLLGNLSKQSYTGPNLMERVKVQRTESSGVALARALLPAAALLLITAGCAAATAWERVACRRLELDLGQYTVQQQRVEQLQRQIIRDMSKAKHLQQIEDALLNPAWNEVALNIGKCLPDDVWLDTVTADEKGRVSLAGSSFTDLGIIEFVDSLRKLPTVAEVALSGTRTDRLANGPSVTFDVYCEIAGPSGEEEKGGESS